MHYVWISPLELHMHLNYACRKTVIENLLLPHLLELPCVKY